MLAPETLLQLQKYNFDLLAHQEPSGRRRLRYIALAHIKDGKSPTETALTLRVTPRAVTRWLKWFIDEGLDRVAGIPHASRSHSRRSRWANLAGTARPPWPRPWPCTNWCLKLPPLTSHQLTAQQPSHAASMLGD
jgi:hypothetical protein